LLPEVEAKFGATARCATGQSRLSPTKPANLRKHGASQNINVGYVVIASTATPVLANNVSPGIAAVENSGGDTPPVQLSLRPLTVLIAVPTLHAGAADAGAVELVRILTAAGHKAIVVSAGGGLVDAATAAGGHCIKLDMASRNPIVMLRNAFSLARLVRSRRCDLLHAHGRAPAWSGFIAARLAGVPFLTTWYKGFREQNVLKRVYNGVMARGDRVIAVSDQLADLIHDRYGTSWSRIAVVPPSIDLERFDPTTITPERIAAVRRGWGVADTDRVVLVVGRMLRRKGHHLVVEAAGQLKARGLRNFVFVFAADALDTRYAAELWDRVLASGTNDVIRMAGAIDDLPAAFAAAEVAVSAAVQPEGMQRALLEAQAMGRPVIVSDLGAGPEIVLAPPAMATDRMTGMRFATGDAAALAAAVIRLFSMSETDRRVIGTRGRAWIVDHFSAETSASLTLKVYADVATGQNGGSEAFNLGP
jgi:glycosyltransferase involved in cell wall biosynthesis